MCCHIFTEGSFARDVSNGFLFGEGSCALCLKPIQSNYKVNQLKNNILRRIFESSNKNKKTACNAKKRERRVVSRLIGRDGGDCQVTCCVIQ